MNRSPEQIQRDIQRTQSEIGETLEAIKRRLSPEEIMNRATAYLRAGPGEFGRNLGRTIRDNPVPVALIGVGIGWLMFGGSRRSSRTISAAPIEGGTSPGDWEVKSGSHLPERLRHALDRSRSRASEARDKVRSAGERMREMGHAGGERLSHLGHDLRSGGRRVGEYGQRMWHELEEQWYEHPLVMGALAFGIGAAVAVALPSTRREEELVGGPARDLMERARETGAEYYERAKEVARSATHAGMDAAREEAEAQGLTREHGGRAGVGDTSSYGPSGGASSYGSAGSSYGGPSGGSSFGQGGSSFGQGGSSSGREEGRRP